MKDVESGAKFLRLPFRRDDNPQDAHRRRGPVPAGGFPKGDGNGCSSCPTTINPISCGKSRYPTRRARARPGRDRLAQGDPDRG